MTNIEILKRCPFCGSYASIKRGNLYMDLTYRAECNKCFAMTARFLVNHPKVNPTDGTLDESTRYTEEQAIRKAVEAWNTRISDAQALQHLCDIVCKTNYGDEEITNEKRTY